jgi:hypothetical protein
LGIVGDGERAQVEGECSCARELRSRRRIRR